LTQTTVQSGVTVYQTGETSVQSLGSIPTTNHPPIIALMGSSNMTVMTNSTFTDPGASASDEEDGNISGSIITSGSVNTLIPATYPITYDVKDSQNFSAPTVTRNVTVVSSCNPTLAGSAATDSNPVGVFYQTGYTYVINSIDHTLQAFNVSNAAN